MTLGYSMHFCGTCLAETNHRIVERNGRTKKECVACHQQVAYWPNLKSAISAQDRSADLAPKRAA